MSAIVGSAGLRGTWAALEAGKTVALANKETLVVGGPLVTELAAETSARILPVDSEHSAVFQALQAGRRDEVRRVMLTASGGPFRKFTARATGRSDAWPRPWRIRPGQMGPKITIDSATMMNKALEIIEARWLFDLRPDQIDVVIHPQSIVHSMVEFVDGSVIAQLEPAGHEAADPVCVDLAASGGRAWRRSWTWSEAMQLEFEPPDFERFPALAAGAGGGPSRRHGRRGAQRGQRGGRGRVSAPGELRFAEIVPACRSVLEQPSFRSPARRSSGCSSSTAGLVRRYCVGSVLDRAVDLEPAPAGGRFSKSPSAWGW